MKSLLRSIIDLVNDCPAPEKADAFEAGNKAA
jgi:hypothetical protein